MHIEDNIFERDEARASTRFPRLHKSMLVATAVSLCFAQSVLAQTPDSQAGDSNKSWTVTTDSKGENVSPTRTLQSHTRSGNRTVDVQSLQVLATDGSFQPFQDIETETVQVNATTVQTTTRTFARDASGAKSLFQITKEEKQTLTGGNSKVVRTTSNPDINGNLQLVQREVQETLKTGPDSEETKTTVMLPDISGVMAPVMQMHERQKRNGNMVEIQNTTLLPDGAGKWQVGEIRKSTNKAEGTNRSTDERVSRTDFEGNLAEVTRTVRNESADVSGEKRKSEETYSIDVPGAARDSSLHMVQRMTTTQHTNSGNHQTIQVTEQPNFGASGAGLQVTAITTDTVSLGPSGAQATQTIQVPNGDGSLGVIFLDMTKSNNANAIEVQIAPSKPR